MIEKLTLHHFRQHKDLTINFSKGTSVIRGSNEAGKTTIFEGITYALFGVTACRNNDITTWGETPNSHKVELVLNVNSKRYTITRSQRGAEVIHADGMVSGQTEVSRFCEEILDLKPNTGSKLMFIGQNAIRGVLEETRGKINTMIEQLAGFQDVEKCIQILQTEFDTGKVDVLEQSLTNLKQMSDNLNRELQDIQIGQQLPQAEQELKQLQQTLQDLNIEYQDLEQQTHALEQSINDKQEDLRQYENLTKQSQDCLAQIQNLDNLIKGTRIETVEESEIQQLSEQVKTITEQFHIWSNYCLVRDFTPHKRLAMTRQDLTKLVLDTENEIHNIKASKLNYQTQITQLKQQKHQDLMCPTCKRAWDNVEQMQQANAELENRIYQIHLRLEADNLILEDLETKLKDLREVLNILEPDVQDSDFWVKDLGYCPALFTLKGNKPKEVSERDVQIAQNSLNEANLKQQVAIKMENNLQQSKTKLLNLQIENVNLNKAISSLNFNREAYQAELQNLETNREKLQSLRLNLQEVKAKVEMTSKQIEHWRSQSSKLQEQIQLLSNSIHETQSKIDDMNLNNSLLKALRNIKPLVADRLWVTLCSSISHYFSQMRGVQSVVSKGETGFVVDGKDVASLSGSTQDILGLAIRVALTKTFIPNCRFLLLDEPFSACDAQRQALALGFITSTGFDQMLIVTHEDTTQMVADNLLDI